MIISGALVRIHICSHLNALYIVIIIIIWICSVLYCDHWSVWITNQRKICAVTNQSNLYKYFQNKISFFLNSHKKLVHISSFLIIKKSTFVSILFLIAFYIYSVYFCVKEHSVLNKTMQILVNMKVCSRNHS